MCCQINSCSIENDANRDDRMANGQRITAVNLEREHIGYDQRRTGHGVTNFVSIEKMPGYMQLKSMLPD